MPYTITSKCSGTETICGDICPYECIHTSEEGAELVEMNDVLVGATAANGKRSFQIDGQFCVDCGMCAIACPTQAIVYNGPFHPMYLGALGQAVWLRPQARLPRG